MISKRMFLNASALRFYGKFVLEESCKSKGLILQLRAHMGEQNFAVH